MHLLLLIQGHKRSSAQTIGDQWTSTTALIGVDGVRVLSDLATDPLAFPEYVCEVFSRPAPKYGFQRLITSLLLTAYQSRHFGSVTTQR